MLCYVMLCYVMLCYVMLCHVILCPVWIALMLVRRWKEGEGTQRWGKSKWIVGKKGNRV